MELKTLLDPNILWPTGIAIVDLVTGSISNAKIQRLSIILKGGIGLLKGLSASLGGLANTLQRIQDYGNGN